MPRFVILHHDWPAPHYDLMLEADGVLKTWRLARLGDTDAELISDHRLDYLDYEGPVSGDRGNVKRWDGGTFEWIDTKTIRLKGLSMNGIYTFLIGADGRQRFTRSV